MRQHEVREFLRHEPFCPFRVHLSNGQSHDVRHPELAALTRHSVVVVIPEDNSRQSNDDGPDRIIQCDLVHVVALEPLNASNA